MFLGWEGKSWVVVCWVYWLGGLDSGGKRAGRLREGVRGWKEEVVDSGWAGPLKDFGYKQ